MIEQEVAGRCALIMRLLLNKKGNLAKVLTNIRFDLTSDYGIYKESAETIAMFDFEIKALFYLILSLIRERDRLKRALLELSRNCASCPKAMEFLSVYAGENDKENVASACQVARWQTSN